ncbi:M15 family metallopeptidase [Sphingomonas yantingensis]|uniref:D-alanyl-D-alanine carboxypeptidase n=1 Tax=Sphingomonas yantingensis TaxID=1241761 RepID=A0A7W9EJ72_9SPHN|nr:M15 family metallopeptidase [Sphingomonas yantingensis]MBB5698760.1 D-alanyl-D-alanine carboxypeptidase [Sphingomonas yantingensis]
MAPRLAWAALVGEGALLALAGCAPVAKPAPAVTVAAPAPMTPLPAAPPPVLVAAARPPMALCGRGIVSPGPDGRMLNHFPYPEMPASALVPAPASLGDSGCRVHPAMLPDLQRLIAAADADPRVAGKLRAVSCQRSIAFQERTFCAGILSGRTQGFTDRAWASAPPGHSEHATGYVIDFGTRDRGGCPDADACFAASDMGKWLLANAARYGFELSFPAGNRQQVKWEPWHWRWVGTSAAAAGAEPARRTFALARAKFPANPGVE